MDYSRNFEIGMKMVYKVFTVLGLNIFEANYRLNWRTACTVLFASFANLCIFYTLFYYRNDLMMSLKCLCVAPEAFQGIVKLYTILRFGPKIVSTVDFIRHIYRQNKNLPHRIEALKRCSEHLVYCVKIIIILLIFVFSVIMLYPIYSVKIQGKRELLFEILIIGYEIKSSGDYIFCLILQMTETLFAFTGNNLCDLLLCILTIHISLLVGLLKLDLNETIEMIGKEEDRIVRDSMRKCILKHKEILNYILTINEIYAATFTYQTATASLSLAMNCFFTVTTDYLPAYGLGVFALLKIFTLCILGTFVEIMNDNIYQYFFEFPWYRLSIDCKKMYYVALMKSQKYHVFKIGKVIPLNVATGVKIIKANYSYLMMLLNVDQKPI